MPMFVVIPAKEVRMEKGEPASMTEITISADRAIERLEFIRDKELWAVDKLSKAVIKMSIEALREKDERDNPKPIPYEQLGERDGQPIWIEDLILPACSMWHLVCNHPTMGLIAIDKLGKAKGNCYTGCYYQIDSYPGYGETWLPYACPPRSRELKER